LTPEVIKVVSKPNLELKTSTKDKTDSELLVDQILFVHLIHPMNLILVFNRKLGVRHQATNLQI
jgi:hypothetical protein